MSHETDTDVSGAACPQPRPAPEAASDDRLIVDHIPLVGHIVRETMGRLPSHMGRDDLMSAGLAALVAAARSYDGGRGVPFARYAAIRIRGAILDELRGIDWASRSVRRRAREVEQAKTDLCTTLGRPATDREVASALGISIAELAANEHDVNRANLLTIDGIGETSAERLLPSPLPTPEESVEQHERLAYMVDAIAELPDRLRTVVEEYFFGARPMLEIANELGVTESRVSQMRAEALGLLRDAMNHALDPDLVYRCHGPAGAAARRRDAYFAAVAARRSVAARLAAPGSVDAIA